jgi:nicotinate-nucleotide adenylyltransferase
VNDRRLGLFGGTFDPPHLGHVAALRAASASGRFKRIIVTVAGDPYLKSADVHSADLRLAMAHAAFDDIGLVDVSDMEIRRSGPSYTIDTVGELLGDDQTLDLIVGADLVSHLNDWHEAQALRELVEVAIVPRPGSSVHLAEGWRGYEISMRPVDLSSTFIRSMGANNKNLKNFLPTGVIPLFVRAEG